MRSRRTVGGWALVVSVLAAWALAVVAAWAGLAPSVVDPEDGVALGPSADLSTEVRQVVLVGVPGLTWDLVSPDGTPHLVALAREGGSAALVLRGTHERTCEEDAWLTVGAGQRAATALAGCEGADDDAGSLRTALSAGQVDEETWRAWQELADRQALGAELGTLAELAVQGGTCVAAYGVPALIGAGDADGMVRTAVGTDMDPVGPETDRFAALSAVTAGLEACRIHLVAGPEIQAGDRSGILGDVDAAVGTLSGSLPDGTTLLVAGMGHTGGPPAQVLVAAPVGEHPGAATLTSGSTRQSGLVQLTDLAPTLLWLAGVDAPSQSPLAGQVVVADPWGAGRADPRPDVAATAPAADLAAGISWVKQVAPQVLAALVVGTLVVLALGATLVVGPRRRTGATGRGPVVGRGPAVGRSLVLGAASFALAGPVATWLAGLLPWWRSGQPMFALLGSIVLWAVVIAAVGWAGPWREHPLGPAAVVAAVTLVVVYVDAVWSARLGLVSVLGLQPVTAGRFYGQGNVGLGITLGAALVLMAALLTWLQDRPRQAAAAVAFVGLGATALNGAPTAGADFGGVPALVVATGLLVLQALGVRWTWRSLLGVSVVGAVAAVGLMVLDWLRGPERRTHLGGFVQSVLDGEAWGVVSRKLAQNLGILLGYPVSWLVVLLLVLLVVVVVRQPAWSHRLWRHAGVRPAVLAAVPAMVLAWLLNDSGLPAMGACLAVLIAAGVGLLVRPVIGPLRSGDRPAPGTAAERPT